MSQAIESISEALPDILAEVGQDIAGKLDPYTYKNNPPKDYYVYNMESQAEILADYFMQEIIRIDGYLGKYSNRRFRTQFFYEKSLENFFIEIEKSNDRPRDLISQWSLK